MTLLRENRVRISLLMALGGAVTGIGADIRRDTIPEALPATENMTTDVRDLPDEEQGDLCEQSDAAYHATMLTMNLANAYHQEDQYLRFLHETRQELEADGCTRSEEYIQTLINIASIYKEKGIDRRIASLPQVDVQGHGRSLDARIRPGREIGATKNLLEARDWYLRACAAIEDRKIAPDVMFFALYGLGHTEELLDNYAQAEVLLHHALSVLPKEHDDDYDYLVNERLTNIDGIMAQDEE